jgi:hypothetical protein
VKKAKGTAEKSSRSKASPRKAAAQTPKKLAAAALTMVKKLIGGKARTLPAKGKSIGMKVKAALTAKKGKAKRAARPEEPLTPEHLGAIPLSDLEEAVSRAAADAEDVAAGEATKFDIGITHNGKARSREELPFEYGTDRVVLLVVDPRFVFTYWEIRDDSIAQARRDLGPSARLTLRFYDISATGNPDASAFWDVEVFDRLGNWYLRLAHPEQRLCLDIGMRNAAGHFYRLARSNILRLPPQSLAKPGPIKWMVITPAGDRLISDIEEYTDADLALLKKILGPYFFDLLMRGRLASIAGSSVEAVFYDIQQLPGLEQIGGVSSPGISSWTEAH